MNIKTDFYGLQHNSFFSVLCLLETGIAHTLCVDYQKVHKPTVAYLT